MSKTVVKNRTLTEVLTAMRPQVQGWQEAMIKSTAEQDVVYIKTVDDAIGLSNQLMKMIEAEGIPWMQQALLLSLQAICSGEEFTHQMSLIETAVAKNHQILIFENKMHLEAFMGKAAGRG